MNPFPHQMKSQFRSIFSSICLISCSTLIFSLCAQAQHLSESIESETLSRPVVAPNDSGMYAGINKLPESIRRSAPFARAFEEMKRRAGTSGTFDYEARMQAIEQAQRDLMNSSSIAEKSSGGGACPLSN